MKILGVTAHLDKGGGQQTQTIRVMQELSVNHDVKLISLYHNKANCKDHGFPIELVGRLSYPLGILKLARSIRKHKHFDIIQAFDPYYSLPAAYLSMNRPYCFRAGIYPKKDLESRGMYLQAQISRILVPIMLRSSCAIAVNSNTLLHLSKKALVIRNGFKLDQFKIQENKSMLRKKYGISKTKLILLYVGKVIPRKNLEIVLRAIEDIDCEFLVVGDYSEPMYGDQYKKSLEQEYASVMEKVSFIGEVPMKKVIDYLTLSDVFVFPSKLEGSPNAVLEAMACGLPVVVSDIPEHRDIIKDKRTGLIFNDIKTLKKSILKAKDSIELSKNAKKYIMDHHDISKNAKQYITMYEKCLN